MSRNQFKSNDKVKKKKKLDPGLGTEPRPVVIARELEPTDYVLAAKFEEVEEKLAKAEKALRRQAKDFRRYERTRDETIAYLESKIDSLSKPFLPGLPKQGRNILSERTLHYYVCEDLRRVREDLTELIKRYEDTMGRSPNEETLTEILAWQLSKEGVGLDVSLTTKPIESKGELKMFSRCQLEKLTYAEGHDLVLQLLKPNTREPLWICYLQAKKLSEERVAGFGYRFDQYAQNKSSLDKLLDELDMFRYGWFEASKEFRTRCSQEVGKEKQYFQELLNKYDQEQCKKFTDYIEKIKNHEESGGAQVELLYNKINREQAARKESHPRCKVTGG
ncbi:unnamed protein product [Rhizoctonia solani]|uniref:Uncharacterized protein n=1 Tax=Rhizoctonia solani TaxID=456999 RepID=A0A8H3I6I2_9AGAM|nr:unnamed protein product [Rhizoctonia solani]